MSRSLTLGAPVHPAPRIAPVAPVALVAPVAPFAATAAEHAPATQLPAGFEVLRTLEIGRAPHGIRFSADGSTAYVALSGDDEIAVVDLAAMRVDETDARVARPSAASPAGTLTRYCYVERAWPRTLQARLSASLSLPMICSTV